MTLFGFKPPSIQTQNQLLGLGPEIWRVLDLSHNKRILGEYEGMMAIDARLVADLIKATQQVWQALPKP